METVCLTPKPVAGELACRQIHLVMTGCGDEGVRAIGACLRLNSFLSGIPHDRNTACDFVKSLSRHAVALNHRDFMAGGHKPSGKSGPYISRPNDYDVHGTSLFNLLTDRLYYHVRY